MQIQNSRLAHTNRSASESHAPVDGGGGFEAAGHDPFRTYPPHLPDETLRSGSPPPWFIAEPHTPIAAGGFQEGGKFIPELEDGHPATAVAEKFTHPTASSPDPSVRSIPSTPSEFTYDSRSPPDSLSLAAELQVRNELHGYLDDGEVDGLYSGTGGLTRTFPREGKPVPSERMPVDPRSLYKTYPLNDPHVGHRRVRTSYAHPASSEALQVRSRPSETDLAMQNLAKLNVSNKVTAPSNWAKGKLLGSGAFGQVFICHDLETGRELGVKVIDLDHVDHALPSTDSLQMQREIRSLETELQLLKNLRHERIVTYYGTERTDGKLYIFMEYMHGGSVYQHLRDTGPLNEILARKYTRQILEGVMYLHDNRIVHRDIKGANILRDSDGNVKIADFGASKRLQTIRSGRAGLKSVQGTPYWMAPEVIKADPYSDRADVWSIGATVVEMLKCHPPWYEFEPTAAMFKIVTEDTHPDLPPHCSEHAQHFLEQCFIKDKNQRPSVRELLEYPFVNT